MSRGVFDLIDCLIGYCMSTPTERRYRREARYSKQLRVTVQPATAAALAAEAFEPFAASYGTPSLPPPRTAQILT